MSLYKKRSAPIRIALSVMTLSGLVLTAQAQGTSAAALSGSVSLKDVFETAWQRQPEAYALQSRRDAAQAQAGRGVDRREKQAHGLARAHGQCKGGRGRQQYQPDGQRLHHLLEQGLLEAVEKVDQRVHRAIVLKVPNLTISGAAGESRPGNAGARAVWQSTCPGP